MRARMEPSAEEEIVRLLTAQMARFDTLENKVDRLVLLFEKLERADHEWDTRYAAVAKSSALLPREPDCCCRVL